jgi:hypothetical protein
VKSIPHMKTRSPSIGHGSVLAPLPLEFFHGQKCGANLVFGRQHLGVEVLNEAEEEDHQKIFSGKVWFVWFFNFSF